MQHPLTLHQQHAHQLIANFTPNNRVDEVIWKFHPSGSFSVRSIYQILAQGGRTRFRANCIWKMKVIPSVRLFFFFMLKNKLLTQEVMQRRHINFQTGCALCGCTTTETAMHLFFHCPYSHHVWSNLSSAEGYELLSTNDTPLDTYLNSAPPDKIRLTSWTTLFATATWMIWRERNNRFSEMVLPHTTCLHQTSGRKLNYTSGIAEDGCFPNKEDLCSHPVK